MVRMHLIEARQQRRWSQQDVADRIGTTQNNVSRWERGSTTPNPYFRAKLCELFGQTPFELELVPLSSTLTALTVEPNTVSADVDQHIDRLGWQVPYPRNPFFTGRIQLLEKIHEHLHSQSMSRSCTISGLGGMGKTQMALEYAYRYARDYLAVWWVNAETEEEIISSFFVIADVLHLSEHQEQEHQRIVTAVLRWFNSHDHWLLIFDNVEQRSTIERFLPSAFHGSLLLTTRRQALGMTGGMIELETMVPEESMHLLLHRARVLEVHASLPADELNAAHAIVVSLGGLPLALDQAGAYIEATQCNISDYFHLLQTVPLRLLQEREDTGSHPLSVTRTFMLAFEQITQHNMIAAHLLTMCAFLAPEAIPERLIHEGAVYLGSDIASVVNDPLHYHAVVKEMLSYALIRRHGQRKLLTMHRLVQIVLKNGMTKSEQKTWIERVLTALGHVFPEERLQVEKWDWCEQLLPHAMVCLSGSKQWEQLAEVALPLLLKVSHYLRDRVRLKEAMQLLQEMLPFLETGLSTNHVGVFDLWFELAESERMQGFYEQARVHYQHVLSLYEHAFGPASLQVANTCNSLCFLLREIGKLELAEEFGEKALEIRKRLLGSDHPEVARTIGNLAIVAALQGKYEQAEQYFLQSLHSVECTLGPDHPDTGQHLGNLAELYQRQGKYEQAVHYSERALQIQQQALGSDHPDIAHTLHSLGEAQLHQQHYEQAEHHLKRAFQLMEQSFGSSHPIVAYPLHSLGRLSLRQRDYIQAEHYFCRALCILESRLEPQHPDLADLLYDIATIQEVQKTYQKAFVTYQRVLTIYEQVYGSHHAKTRETRVRLQKVGAFFEQTEHDKQQAGLARQAE